MQQDLDAFGFDGEARAALEKAISAQGSVEDLVDPDADFMVIPENWTALSTFLRFSTQWRSSMNGATGLDYTPLILYLRTKHRSAWEEVFDEVQHIERGALMAMAEKRQQANG